MIRMALSHGAARRSMRLARKALLEALEDRRLLSGEYYHLTFDDEFNVMPQIAHTIGSATPGYLPTDYWNNHYLSGNGEQQYYVFPGIDTGYDPFSVTNGILTITANPTPPGMDADGQPYVSGELTTSRGANYAQNVRSSTPFSQQYGYFEVRAKLPSGKGLWPAFWLLPDNGSWPPEYDVFEVLGHDTDSIYQTAHWNDNGHKSQGMNYAGVIDSATGFHTYGFEWNATTIRWYVDGVLTQTQMNRVNTPMYMLVNLTVGGYWPGNPDATTPWPANMDIDYIRVYSANPAAAAVTPQSSYSISSTLPINVTRPPVADAYVKGGTSASQNFGTDTVLWVKEDTNPTWDRRSYLRFDLSNYSEASYKSVLELPVDSVGAGSSSMSIEVRFVASDSWTETGITWNNQPATSTVLATIAGSSLQAGGTVQVDLTGAVNDAISGDKKLSIALVAVNTEGTDRWVKFASREYATVARRPALEVNSATVNAILDNADTRGITYTGTWTNSTSTPGYYGSSYRHDGNIDKDTKSVRFTPDLLNDADYEVFARWTAAANRATNVPIDVISAAGTSTLTVNQQQNNGQWYSLGTYAFNAGTGGSVLIRTTGTNGYVIADAVRFVQVSGGGGLSAQLSGAFSSTSSGIPIQNETLTKANATGELRARHLLGIPRTILSPYVDDELIA